MKSIVAMGALLLVSTSAFAAVHTVEAGSAAQERLQTALLEAEPGDTVKIGAGRFELTDGLSLDVDNVTVRGAGPEESILDFTGQIGSGEGLMVTSDDVVLHGFAVENTRGDGIKSKGANRIVYDNLRVEWTNGPDASNGAYGIYPVESTHVLVQNSRIIGASDAGIYVGQSQQIIVRKNMVTHNVAGIEIENSYYADVYYNIAKENTSGILVYDLPNLPQMGGHSVRVFNNMIWNNNTANFAPEGNIVANVPAGTGVMVMANRNVHVYENVIQEHGTSNVMLVAYTEEFDDPNYEPTIRDVIVHGNAQGRAGYAPDFPGGAELATAVGGTLPPVLWDGLGTGIVVNDKVPVLSLGLTAAGQPVSEARAFMAEIASEETLATPEAVILPASMEAALQ